MKSRDIISIKLPYKPLKSKNKTLFDISLQGFLFIYQRIKRIQLNCKNKQLIINDILFIDF